MNPSVGALKRILDGIPMGLAEFFAIDAEHPRKAFYRADELPEIGKKPISYRQVGDNLFGRALQILKENYGPGADTGRVPLVHDGEEGGIVISGRLKVTVDGERRVLGSGRCLLFRESPPASIPLRRQQALRGDQCLHAADVLRRRARRRCASHLGREVLDDPDRHIGESVELAQEHVALHHRADILRRAGIDDVAGLQLERLGQFCDLLGDAPDHLLKIGVLPHHAVDRERDRALGQMTDLAHRVDRTEHGGMIKTLADLPGLLLGGHAVLQIAPRHVETGA